MDNQTLVDTLLALDSLDAQTDFLYTHQSEIDDEVAQALKARSDKFLVGDIDQCERVADILVAAGEITRNPFTIALGLLARANALTIGHARHEESIPIYDKAAAIYATHGRRVDQAKSQTGKLWALVNLGQYDEAIQTGEWASQILREQEEWFLLGKMMVNTGIIYARSGDDRRGLEHFNEARELYQKTDTSDWIVAGVELDRAIVLRNLGKFKESIQASQDALSIFDERTHRIDIGRAKQSLGVTYFILGRYNEALILLEETRTIFAEDGLERYALLAELFISDCLLALRRYPEVLQRTRRVKAQFMAGGNLLEVGQALRNEAVAYAQLRDFGKAKESLKQARQLFVEDQNQLWSTHIDLETAWIGIEEGDLQTSLNLARACAAFYQSKGLPAWEAAALLLAARAAQPLSQRDLVEEQVAKALSIGERLGLPGVLSQGKQIRGEEYWSEGDLEAALVEYQGAIEAFEKLRGRLMIEYRARFQSGREDLYESAVLLCVESEKPAAALRMAERSKSRALVDMLAYRLNMQLTPRTAGDAALVGELTRLREERDQLYRRWLSAEELREESSEFLDAQRRQTWEALQEREREIAELWHKLLVRDADYAREASLWQVQNQEVIPPLSKRQALVEYFVAGEEILAFVVSDQGVRVWQLSANIRQVGQQLQLFWMNLRLLQATPVAGLEALTGAARQILQGLEEALLAPLRDVLSTFKQLTIVPHGLLHYIPFHALYDGSRYLLEKVEISYLPAAGLLQYCQAVEPANGAALILGNSSNGQLPHAVAEARAVAGILAGEAQVEGEATAALVRQNAESSPIIHLASHGDFRPDNPLFSSISLADGWLTTLDIFNLKLRASLVTLSGCQTGRSVVGGGDELLGLMRAFLYAGTASLALSLWVVEDRSTALLMEAFYRALVAGQSRAQALQAAQLALIHPSQGENGGDLSRYQHPFYWAPFILVGDSGKIGQV